PMHTKRIFMMLLALVAFTIVHPMEGRGQSNFTGVVKDTTGAVLPGVTLEASSPALIEGTRTVLTDERGTYKILDLRPGRYTLTFSYPGFTTVKLEGIDLSSNFTATINAEMKVSSFADTATLETDTPLVTLQTPATRH